MRKVLSTVAFGSAASATQAQTGVSVRQGRGSVNLTVGSLALRAVYATTSAGLRASISILDRRYPNAILLQEDIILRGNQQRVIELPSQDGTAIRFVIKRSGDTIAVAATGERNR